MSCPSVPRGLDACLVGKAKSDGQQPNGAPRTVLRDERFARRMQQQASEFWVARRELFVQLTMARFLVADKARFRFTNGVYLGRKMYRARRVQESQDRRHHNALRRVVSN